MPKYLFLLITFFLFFGVLAPIIHAQTVSSNSFCTSVGGADPKQNPCAQAAGNLKFYCQWDKQWGAHRIGPNSCDTVAAAGCGPASLAMLLSAYGGTMTPPQVADIITNENEFVCGKDGGTAMGQILTGQNPHDIDTRNQLGIEVAPISLAIGNNFNFDQAQKLLDPSSGYLIIGSSSNFKGCSCGHIFVVQSVNPAAGEVTLRDPNNCDHSTFQEVPDKMVYKANNISNNGSGWLYAYAVRKVR